MCAPFSSGCNTGPLETGEIWEDQLTLFQPGGRLCPPQTTPPLLLSGFSKLPTALQQALNDMNIHNCVESARRNCKNGLVAPYVFILLNSQAHLIAYYLPDNGEKLAIGSHFSVLTAGQHIVYSLVSYSTHQCAVVKQVYLKKAIFY